MPFTECQLRRRRTSQAGRIRRTGTRRQRQKHLLLPAQIAIDNTTRDRPSGRSFFCFVANTPTPEFCENSRERGPRSPAGTAEGFDPPLGAQRSAAARGGGCAGAGRVAAYWRRCASAGAARAGFCRDGGERALCRAARRALSAREAGAFLPGGGPPTGRGRGLAAWGPQRPRVGRDGAWRARFRAAGRGRYTAAFRGGRGEGAGRAALYGGRAGYIRGGGPIAGARRHRTGKKRSELRGLCRVTGHRWEWRQRRGRKGPFSLYKEALFAGARALSIQS